MMSVVVRGVRLVGLFVLIGIKIATPSSGERRAG